jgi:hypothetical protein
MRHHPVNEFTDLRLMLGTQHRLCKKALNMANTFQTIHT